MSKLMKGVRRGLHFHTEPVAVGRPLRRKTFVTRLLAQTPTRSLSLSDASLYIIY